jgi:hypothetical protein
VDLVGDDRELRPGGRSAQASGGVVCATDRRRRCLIAPLAPQPCAGRLGSAVTISLLLVLSATPDGRAQTTSSGPTVLLGPSLGGNPYVVPRVREAELSAPREAPFAGQPLAQGGPVAAPRIRQADLATPASEPRVVLPATAQGDTRQTDTRQAASARRIKLSSLDPLLDAAPADNKLYPPSIRREDIATGASSIRVPRRRANDGLFGAPDAGVMDGGPAGRRCRVGDTSPGCVVRLAFNAAPPPPTRALVPRNLPVIPPKDAKPIPPTLASKPPEPPMMEMDPYEPTGFKSGNFLFKPALEMSAGYDSNPARVPMGRGSAVFVVAPELLVRSQFERHQLNADLRGSYTDTPNLTQLNHPNVDARVNGRYDVTNTTAINGEARYILDIDDPGTLRYGNVNLLTKVPMLNTVGGTVGVTQDFDRTQVSVKGAFDRVTFQNALLTTGVPVNNQDRNFNQVAGQARVTYALTPEYKPFIDVAVDRRTHDMATDFNGFRRDSTGVAVEAGMTFNLADKLTGDAAVGYLMRNYADQRLPSAGGFIADATLAWQVTKETSVQLEAKSQVTEISDAGTSGVFKRDVKAELDYQFQPWLIGNVKAGLGQDVFAGTQPQRVDDRYFVGAGLLYKVSRMFQLKADLRQEWTLSNTAGNNLTASVVMLGGRVQY